MTVARADWLRHPSTTWNVIDWFETALQTRLDEVAHFSTLFRSSALGRLAASAGSASETAVSTAMPAVSSDRGLPLIVPPVRGPAGWGPHRTGILGAASTGPQGRTDNSPALTPRGVHAYGGDRG